VPPTILVTVEYVCVDHELSSWNGLWRGWIPDQVRPAGRRHASGPEVDGDDRGLHRVAPETHQCVAGQFCLTRLLPEHRVGGVALHSIASDDDMAVGDEFLRQQLRLDAIGAQRAVARVRLDGTGPHGSAGRMIIRD